MDNEIVIVSGLPRSGTSLMMSMLQAAGLNIVTDHIRSPDEDNPKGYFEYEIVKKIKDDASWLPDTRGKVFKMVSMLLYNLPSSEKYRIIIMRRNLEEVLASQTRMLQRTGIEKNMAENEQMYKLYQKHLIHLDAWVTKQPCIDVLYINYNELIDSPQKSIESIDHFLGGHLNIANMLDVIDRSLYRNRSSVLLF